MKQIIIFLLTAASLMSAQPIKSKQIVDLRGTWKFEIGDSKQWSDPKFNDSKWNDIFVPADWENEGFPGYDGYAWYRNRFKLPQNVQDKELFFHLIVDDVCAVYINGNLIGEGGQFPPHYGTAYNVHHEFFIPAKYLRYNQENIVAVRVYDDHLYGGIVSGKVGVFTHETEMELAVKIPEVWKLNEGDYREWKEPNFNDSEWEDVIVPAKWDFQGHRNFDGIAWYRVSFDVPSNFKEGDYVMMLGKIDDFDETYLNGVLIGTTGIIRSNGRMRRSDTEYKLYRGYSIPNGVLKVGQKNVIAVRVYDQMSWGGIYEGPIGIVKERDFKHWESKYEINQDYNIGGRNDFERFIDKFFKEN